MMIGVTICLFLFFHFALFITLQLVKLGRPQHIAIFQEIKGTISSNGTLGPEPGGCGFSMVIIGLPENRKARFRGTVKRFQNGLAGCGEAGILHRLLTDQMKVVVVY